MNADHVEVLRQTVTRDLGRMVGVPTPFIDAVLGPARLKATSLGLLGRAA